MILVLMAIMLMPEPTFTLAIDLEWQLSEELQKCEDLGMVAKNPAAGWVQECKCTIKWAVCLDLTSTKTSREQISGKNEKMILPCLGVEIHKRETIF